MVVGIVAVGRIAIDFGHLQSAGGRRLLFASDRRGVKADQSIRLVEQPGDLSALVDLYPVSFGGILALSEACIDDDDLVSRALELLCRVQVCEALLAHVEFLGKRLWRAGKAQ